MPSKQQLFTSIPLHTELLGKDLPLFADQVAERPAGAAKGWRALDTLGALGDTDSPVIPAETLNSEYPWILGLYLPRLQDHLILCCASLWEVDSH